MKYKFITILLSILFLTCSNNDDSSSDDNERLIGQWKIVERIIDGNQSVLGECEPFSIYTYNENGTYTELHYAADINTPCLDNPSVEFDGNWQKNNGANYSFTNSSNETSNVMIEFSSNNSFSLTFSAFSNPNDPINQTIVESYNRIE